MSANFNWSCKLCKSRKWKHNIREPRQWAKPKGSPLTGRWRWTPCPRALIRSSSGSLFFTLSRGVCKLTRAQCSCQQSLSPSELPSEQRNQWEPGPALSACAAPWTLHTPWANTATSRNTPGVSLPCSATSSMFQEEQDEKGKQRDPGRKHENSGSCKETKIILNLLSLGYLKWKRCHVELNLFLKSCHRDCHPRALFSPAKGRG